VYKGGLTRPVEGPAEPRLIFSTHHSSNRSHLTMPQTSERNPAERTTRSRSKSPSREHRHKHRSRHARSRSPRRDEERHHHKKRRSRSPPARPVTLPYYAKQLSKRQFEEYKPLFQSYLDIQKQINLDELDERETKGRWKSFIGRW
jgi:hypothetical protein